MINLELKNKISLTSEELKALDLLKFNHGENPYPGDESINHAFKRGISFYRDCLQRVGFTKRGRVLDLGSGFGHWTPFLAEENESVVCIERVPAAVNLAKNLCAFLGFDNIEFRTYDVSAMKNFPDNEFDAVWLWSVLQYVHRDSVMSQISRILKPKGRVFVGSYNSTGLMLQHLINGMKTGSIHEGLADWAKKGLLNGPLGPGIPNYGTVEKSAALCAQYGLELIKASPQGGIDLRNPEGLASHRETPKVLEHYDSTIEFVAEKPEHWTPPEKVPVGPPAGIRRLLSPRAWRTKFANMAKRLFGGKS